AASTFKPATLIESPIVWDGSGLLPGESLSRHRGSRAQSAQEDAEASVPAQTEGHFAHENQTQTFSEEVSSEDVEVPHAVEPAVAQSLDDTASVPAEDEMVEESFEIGSTGYEPHGVSGEPVGETFHVGAAEPELGAHSEQQVGFGTGVEGEA